MQDNQMLDLLQAYKEGKITEIDMLKAINNKDNKGYEDLGFANIDHNRAIRQGFAEVVYCAGKTSEQIAEIMLRLTKVNANVLGTRASEENYQEVKTRKIALNYCPTPKDLKPSPVN